MAIRNHHVTPGEVQTLLDLLTPEDIDTTPEEVIPVTMANLNETLANHPKFLSRNTRIDVNGGSSSVLINVLGFHGPGRLNIHCGSVVSDGNFSNTHIAPGLIVENCRNSHIFIRGMTLTGETGFRVRRVLNLTFNSLWLGNETNNARFLQVSESNVLFRNIHVSRVLGSMGAIVSDEGANVVVSGASGTDNNIVFHARAGTIHVANLLHSDIPNTITGNTMFFTENGGLIIRRNGIVLAEGM